MDKVYYMNIALETAKKSLKHGDVPVGAIIVRDDKVIATAYNRKEEKKLSLAHAEIIAIYKASKKVRNFRLSDCEIYVTKEPCLMCMGALLSARIGKIYYGASDLRFGTSNLANENNFNHKCEIEGGILKDKCESMISDFFKSIR